MRMTFTVIHIIQVLLSFLIDVPLETCWANPDCQQIILEYIPALAGNPNLKAAMPVSLSRIYEYNQAIDMHTPDELKRKRKTILFNSAQQG
jgi:hypothetical protein